MNYYLVTKIIIDKTFKRNALGLKILPYLISLQSLIRSIMKTHRPPFFLPFVSRSFRSFSLKSFPEHPPLLNVRVSKPKSAGRSKKKRSRRWLAARSPKAVISIWGPCTSVFRIVAHNQSEIPIFVSGGWIPCSVVSKGSIVVLLTRNRRRWMLRSGDTYKPVCAGHRSAGPDASKVETNNLRNALNSPLVCGFVTK